MKKYIVAQMNFHDNDLVAELIEADHWKDAFLLHSQNQEYKEEDWFKEWRDELPDSIEGLKETLFDGDILVDIVEIKV